MSDTTTIGYYDINADAFFDQNVGVDMAPLYEKFLAHIPAGGHILDAGCGSGRDARAFLDRGFRVTAFDASAALATKAAALLEQEVRCCRFDEITDTDSFDGICACASLLHVERSLLPGTVSRLLSSLRRGGVFYASFKKGNGERTDASGRHFTDMTFEALRQLLADTKELVLLEAWETQDQRLDQKDVAWWNVIGGRI